MHIYINFLVQNHFVSLNLNLNLHKASLGWGRYEFVYMKGHMHVPFSNGLYNKEIEWVIIRKKRKHIGNFKNLFQVNDRSNDNKI